jgi:hypothetical protein
VYAADTSVPVDRSQAEIKRILLKYGAQAFSFGEAQDRAMVQFQMVNRHIKIIIPLPVHGKFKNKKGYTMSQEQIAQLIRSRWRALVITIKAKLECVECGITTLEQEFMAHIVMPNGHTIGEVMTPQIESAYTTGKMPPLLGMGSGG